MIFNSLYHGDGCWYEPETFEVKELQRVDYAELARVFRSSNFHELNVAFTHKLAAMPQEDFGFVYSAWLKAPIDCTFAERMALARVCRRIIREAKEKES